MKTNAPTEILDALGRVLAALDAPEPERRPGPRVETTAEERQRKIVARLRIQPTANMRELAAAAGPTVSTSSVARYLQTLGIPTDAEERAAMFSFAAGYETGVILGYIAGLAAARRREEEELRAEERP